MKSRIINIILAIVLCISVCGNIFLIKSWSDAKEQMTVFNSQVVSTEKQITDLQDQLHQADLQNQLLDIQEQLNNSTEELKELEDTLSTNQQQIKELEDTLSANQEYIESLEPEQPKQEEQVVEQPVQTPVPQQQIQQSDSHPAGLGNRTMEDATIGTLGTVEPGSLGVGTFE